MIRAQRRVHVATFTALGVVLPIFAWRALALRLAPARVDALPHVLESPTRRSLEQVGDAITDAASAKLVRTPEGRVDLEVSLPKDWSAPDALLYWSASAADSAKLPHDARLCGVVAGPGRWRVVARGDLAFAPEGVAIVFSLARAQVVERLRVAPREDAP